VYYRCAVVAVKKANLNVEVSENANTVTSAGFALSGFEV
jgi:hypothetical protein